MVSQRARKERSQCSASFQHLGSSPATWDCSLDLTASMQETMGCTQDWSVNMPDLSGCKLETLGSKQGW